MTLSLAAAPHRSTSSALGPLAASTDGFGRVMLLDLRRGCVLRMWKGYRDAQMAWLQVSEEPMTTGKKHINQHERMALFLVLYAPRRGLLEVWSAPAGPRVAAFNVCRKGRLLNTPHRLLGLNAANYRAAVGAGQLQSAWFLEENGTVRRFDVPFHVALSARSSSRAHDAALMKRLRAALREPAPLAPSEESALCDAVRRLLSEVRLVGFLEQGLERLLTARHLTASLLESCLLQVQARLGCDIDISGSSSRSSSPQLFAAPPVCQVTGSVAERRRLEAFCRMELSLLTGYKALATLFENRMLLATETSISPELERKDDVERLGCDDPDSWYSFFLEFCPDVVDLEGLRLSRLFSVVAAAATLAGQNDKVATSNNKPRVHFQLHNDQIGR